MNISMGFAYLKLKDRDNVLFVIEILVAGI